MFAEVQVRTSVVGTACLQLEDRTPQTYSVQVCQPPHQLNMRNEDEPYVRSAALLRMAQQHLRVVDHDVQAGDGVEAAALALQVRCRKLRLHLQSNAPELTPKPFMSDTFGLPHQNNLSGAFGRRDSVAASAGESASASKAIVVLLLLTLGRCWGLDATAASYRRRASSAMADEMSDAVTSAPCADFKRE